MAMGRTFPTAEGACLDVIYANLMNIDQQTSLNQPHCPMFLANQWGLVRNHTAGNGAPGL